MTASKGATAGLAGAAAPLESIESVLAAGKPVRRTLDHGGRLHIDRPLPFLCVCRLADEGDDPGTDQLVTGEASFLISTGDPKARKVSRRHLVDIIEHLGHRFGGFLVVEVWAGPAVSETAGPVFRLLEGATFRRRDVVEALQAGLAGVKIPGREPPRVESVGKVSQLPSHGKPLLESRVATALQCTWLGVEVAPVYKDERGERVFPSVLRALRRGFGRALRQALFAFSNNHTNHRVKDVISLGRRAIVKAVWEADEQLSSIQSSFDLLIAANPVNADEAWAAFRRCGYSVDPEFRYRPLPVDPLLLKRTLYRVPIEKVEDPVLVELFREAVADLDRQISMLSDRGTRRFLLGSQQIYGACPPQLVRQAEEILERIPSHARGGGGGTLLTTEEFARHAELEIQRYKQIASGFDATVRISNEVAAGLMVSRGQLLIAQGYRPTQGRIDALIQHEVGTHLVTYYNGRAQRMKQLATGFPGYDELQEGLAVMAEYLVGGMTPARLRILAARVLGVRALIDGATFVDVFRQLCRYGFNRRSAYGVTLRIFRGGGLTKDMIYLRGLVGVLKYLKRGGEVMPLYVGKIAAKHVRIVQELQARRVLAPAVFLPTFLERPEATARLARLRQGMALHELVEPE